MGSYGLPALQVNPPAAPETGNLAQNVGQLAEVKNLLTAGPQEDVLRQQQIQGQQQQLEQTQAINNAYKTAVNVDPNTGQSTIDPDSLTKTLAAAGHGSAIPSIMQATQQYQKLHAETQELQQKVDTGQKNSAGYGAYALIKANYDPGLAGLFLQHQMTDSQTDPAHKQQFAALQQKIDQAPDDVTKRAIVKSFADPLAAQAPEVAKQMTEDTAAQARALTAQVGLQHFQTDPERAQQADWLSKNPGKGPSDYEAWKLSQGSPEKTEMQSWLATNPNKTAADFMKYKASLAPTIAFNLAGQTGAGLAPAAVAQKFGMNQEALDQAAEKYSTTGQLPPAGRSGSGLALSRAIMNRAGELHPGQTLAANSAEYKANADSLKQIQSNTDQMEAFEGTGLRNLDLFLDKASKIPDLGSKLANRPLRYITGTMIGTDNQAALEAARQTASKEVAKVLSSAKGSGVLSDSQAKEVDDILSGNLSLNAMKSVVGTLKQDMANRHSAYSDQINDIKGRLGSKQPAGGNQSNAPTGKAMKITLPSGKVISIE